MEVKERLKEYKTTFLLAYPVSMTYLSHMITGVIDSIMVGQLGADKLAAASLANTVMIIPMVFGLGMSFGLTPLVANAHGGNQSEEINNIQQSGLLVNGLIGLLIFIGMFYGTGIFNFLDQDPMIADMAIPFLQIIAMSMIPFMIFQNYKQFADGVSLTKTAMYISVAGNMINICLNYVLIFGAFGFPEYGLLGAAYATLISRILMAIGIALAINFGGKFKEFNVRLLSRSAFDMTRIRSILSLGGPSGMQMVFEAGAFSISAIMVGWIGYKELAAHQIAISLASMSYVIAAGIGAASTIRVGRQVGAMDYERVRIVGKVGLEMSGIFMAFCGFIFILLCSYLPTLYVNDPEVIEIATVLLIISAAFQIFDGVQVAALGALRGLSDVNWPTAIAAIAYWALGLPFSYVFAFTLGFKTDGIWYGFIVGLGVAAIALTYRFFKKTEKNFDIAKG